MGERNWLVLNKGGTGWGWGLEAWSGHAGVGGSLLGEKGRVSLPSYPVPLASFDITCGP